MKNLKIKSYCKINLSLKVKKKLNNNYHNIASLITFCNLYDLISITKNKKLNDKITFFGKFKKGIDNKSNTITKMLYFLRKNKLLKNSNFKIDVQKNIPHSSGLGGGSSNAATILNYLNLKMKLKLKKKKMIELARMVGSDVPISLERRNTFLTGKQNQMIRINKKFRLNVLIVYPNLLCSTARIYQKNNKRSSLKKPYFVKFKNKKHLINFLKIENNDLESAVVKIYPKIKKIIEHINEQKGCYFSRITGSGSACIGIFSNINNTIHAQKMVKQKYPKYWSVISKTI